MCEIEISAQIIKLLKGGKNLLAFSHGVDSTALFYILNDLGVNFDIAIVDYNIRKESKNEVKQAQNLALKFSKICHTKSVFLDVKNFEKNARDERYAFFNELCKTYGYTNLILAHQLNDLFEWFLMQLSKGAGLSELIGMKECERRENFTLIRPLLGVSKDELLGFLNKQNLEYFIDETNLKIDYKRNFFRHKFAEPFLAKFKSGIKKSFEFLNEDVRNLEPKIKRVKEQFYVVKNDKNALRGIDKVAKIFGILMSENQRKICLSDCVISGKMAIGVRDDLIFITPFIKTKMDKRFKECCRIKKIPKLNRPYLFLINFNLLL
ncbi:tRNA lysidine(34) synthetase TilS [Campylobacter mucosalis]|uniref:tRNA(Ile)-lysidine synthase n=1 Tax=Campylobacter mucosalis CCUG 21559 TaxID=1032067 RepID=A0A6G5QHX3_9BACT|nr:tRNA lysidine(34) synthetase TilS [Campylobacter mucosalis]QCD45303.1 tRNA(Ile)-lysidine synthetase [Campylobacter mucosalis CCUG 21559]